MRSISRLIWLSAIIAVASCSCSGGAAPENDSDSAATYTTTTAHPAESFPDTDRDPNFRDTDIQKPAVTTDPNIRKINAENARGTAQNISAYKDGNYMATVDFFNPVSSYRATYSLKVSVQHGMVVSIAYPHDEYMSDDHITPAELDEDGGCNAYGEHGKVYTVQINHK